jgi:hypothetical protein
MSVQSRSSGRRRQLRRGNAVYLKAGETRFVSNFPPDRKAWAFRSVTSVDTSSGMVGLDRPFDEDFPLGRYFPGGVDMPGSRSGYNGAGKARIYNVDVVNPWGVRHVFNDLTMDVSDMPLVTAGTSCLLAEFNNCAIAGCIYAQMADTGTQAAVSCEARSRTRDGAASTSDPKPMQIFVRRWSRRRPRERPVR